MGQLLLIDTTLREGIQSDFKDLILKNSINYLKSIDEMGIEYAELFHPNYSNHLTKIYKEINKTKFKTKFYTHCNNSISDFDLNIKSGIKNISTFIMHSTNNNMLIEATDRLKKGDENKNNIRLGIENTFSVPNKELVRFFRNLNNFHSLKRIGILDTTGICNPNKLLALIIELDKAIKDNINFEFHLHNDNGLAAANFYTALQIMKKVNRNFMFSISLQGVGERNGILSYGDVYTILLNEKSKYLKNYNINQYHKLLKLVFDNQNFFDRDPMGKNAYKHFAKSHYKIGIEKYQIKIK